MKKETKGKKKRKEKRIYPRAEKTLIQISYAEEVTIKFLVGLEKNK